MSTMYQWLGKHVNSWYGTLIFVLLVVIEGFFVIPISTILAFYCLANRNRALFYALVATVTSVLGALTGYMLGTLIWKAGGKDLIAYIASPEKFDQLVEQFKQNQLWTTFFVALSPVPFKLLTLSAGFCQLPLLPFLGLSMTARGLRFFAIAGAISLWGEKVQFYLNKYFYYLVAAGIAFFILLWFLVH